MITSLIDKPLCELKLHSFFMESSLLWFWSASFLVDNPEDNLFSYIQAKDWSYVFPIVEMIHGLHWDGHGQS